MAKFLLKTSIILLLWIAIVIYEPLPVQEQVGVIFVASVALAIYFLVPALKNVLLCYGGVVFMSAVAHSVWLSPHNYFPWLLYYFLLLEPMSKLSVKQFRLYTVFVLVIVVWPSIVMYGDGASVELLFTWGVLLLVGMYALYSNEARDTYDQQRSLYDQLLTEYRALKRRIVQQEENTRIEERNRIARDMHDSVGHRLTALLMQVEMMLHQTDKKTAEQLQEVKTLAQQSLAETRNAVSALKSTDVEGLESVLHLIRKLEAESHVRVHFTVRHGALTAPLTPEQCVIIYRSIQEALTNAMRHSFAREMHVVLEVLAERKLRFEISNTWHGDKVFQEGFGLKSMRERIEKAAGELTIYQANGRFVVSGMLPIIRGEGVNNDG